MRYRDIVRSLKGASRLVTVGVAVALLAACTDAPSTEQLGYEVEAAVAIGDWTTAVNLHLDLNQNVRVALDPMLIDLVERMVESGSVLPVQTENRVLRRLESDGQIEMARRLLNSSVVEISGGWTVMGTDAGKPDEGPAHNVWIDTYVIDRHEVTNVEFAPFADRTEIRPAHWDGGTYPVSIPTHPVVGVSWQQADEFCRAIGRRLPTEAEWERACRGMEGSGFPWGDTWDVLRVNVTAVPLVDPNDAWAWVDPDQGGPASPSTVGEPSSGCSVEGVCNLADNASEWVADWYDRDAYGTLPHVDPLALGPEWDHVVRGGAWLFRADDLDAMRAQSRCTARNSSHALSDPRVGFRCAVTP